MTCGGCGAALPAVRVPRGLRQALWGGWCCPGCGLEVDRRGQPVEDGIVFEHDHARFEIRRPRSGWPRALLLADRGPAWSCGPVGVVVAVAFVVLEALAWGSSEPARLSATGLAWGAKRIGLAEVRKVGFRGRRLLVETEGGVAPFLLATDPAPVVALIEAAQAARVPSGGREEVPVPLTELFAAVSRR